MQSSLPTRIVAVVVVVALAALFAAPAQAAGGPAVARTGAFSWLSHSLFDWVGALFGVDLSGVSSPKGESGLRSMTEKVNASMEPDGVKTLSSTPTSSFSGVS